MSYIFIDLETGGLHSDLNPVLQIGAIATDDEFNILERFSTFVRPNPDLIVEREALEINKIDLKSLDDAPGEALAMRNFNKFLTKYGHPDLLGFNIYFDLMFLTSICFRNKLHLEASGIFFDLKMLAHRVTDSYKYSLKSTCEYLGIGFKPDHTALKDAEACVEIAKKVLL